MKAMGFDGAQNAGGLERVFSRLCSRPPMSGIVVFPTVEAPPWPCGRRYLLSLSPLRDDPENFVARFHADLKGR
jgi:hypothetical protein